MRALHWVALGAFFTALSTLVATLPNWQDAETPKFVASAIGLFGSFLVALLSGGPTDGSKAEAVGQALRITPKEGQ